MDNLQKRMLEDRPSMPRKEGDLVREFQVMRGYIFSQKDDGGERQKTGPKSWRR